MSAPIESPIPDTLARVRARVADRFPGPDEYATLAGLQEHVVGAAGFLLAYAAGERGAPP